MVRTRFAPSPTGYMQIGNLRTAVYEYLFARRHGGVFILRIEDTDQNRHVEGSLEVILDTLKIMGLDYDEGPGIGGGYGPYVQSERKADYLPHAKKLIENGNAYYCFCTEERLDSLADAHGVTKYDRHCLNISKDEALKQAESGVPYVIRQMIPEGRSEFNDEVFGKILIENNELEDQILIKSDGMPTYNFANVIDDHAMMITHVVRGSEYITSTPKYNLLYKAFGWDCPVYIHLPLLLNEKGEKISKRKGDPSVNDLLHMGYLPSAILNYCVFLGWSPDGNQEIFSLDELTRVFDVRHISKSPAKFDAVKMAWMNGEHIKRLPPEIFYEMALPTLQEAVKTPGIDLKHLAAMVSSRINFISDCHELLNFIDELPDYDVGLFTHKKMKTDSAVALAALKIIFAELNNTANWTNENLYAIATGAAAANGMSNSQILWPLRTAASGKQSSPCGASELCELLGKNESLRRICIAIDKLQSGGAC
ncbi:MAG: glutamate--tRNA ligase [Defluviitaleaceae bacterium]|nr:glutamate--tRNA ligase [Defluviitaleaceae bacterium]